MSEFEPPQDPPASDESVTRRRLPEAPRRFPAGLSGMLVKTFAKIAGIGMAISLVLLLVGLFLEDGYREMQEMRYYGEYVEALAGNPQSDEDGNWATVVYTHAGQQVSAEVDLTDATYSKIAGSPGGMATIPVVFWPEAPNEPESVDWIDAQGGVFEFAWAYWLGVGILVVTMLWATVRAIGLRNRFVRGHEVWARPLEGPSYDAQKQRFSVAVRYDREVGGSDAGEAVWRRGVEPAVDDANRMLLLVEPSRADRPRVVSRRELEAIQTGG